MGIWPDIDGTYVIATWYDDQIRRLGPFPYADVSMKALCVVWVVWVVCVCDCLTVF